MCQQLPRTQLPRTHHQRGYSTILVLAGTLVGMTVLTFVVEVGRLLNTTAEVERALDLGATSAMERYGDIIIGRGKEVFDEAYKEFQEEFPLLTEDELNEKAREVLKEHKDEIVAEARSTCLATAQEVVSANHADLVSATCENEEATLVVKKTYRPFLPFTPFKASDIRRSATKQVYFK